jgi:hypothetical protein
MINLTFKKNTKEAYMSQDPEIIAMSETFEALKHLQRPQIRRIVHWVKDRFGLIEGKAPAEPVVSVSAGEPAPAPAPVKEEKVTLEAAPAPAVIEEPPKPKPPQKRELIDFDTVLDLFSESNVKKVSSKILLMAAYLQERHNFKEISSYDINFRLKRIGHGVQNISSSINGILKRKPQLMIELKKDGASKQARRKFSVTVEGLKVARGFLKGSK